MKRLLFLIILIGVILTACSPQNGTSTPAVSIVAGTTETVPPDPSVTAFPTATALVSTEATSTPPAPASTTVVYSHKSVCEGNPKQAMHSDVPDTGQHKVGCIDLNYSVPGYVVEMYYSLRLATDDRGKHKLYLIAPFTFRKDQYYVLEYQCDDRGTVYITDLGGNVLPTKQISSLEFSCNYWLKSMDPIVFPEETTVYVMMDIEDTDPNGEITEGRVRIKEVQLLQVP